MTEEEFLNKMDKVKNIIEVASIGFICIALQTSFPSDWKVRDLFEELFSPSPRYDGVFFGDMGLNDERIIALEFFEQVCLTEEYYLDWPVV